MRLHNNDFQKEQLFSLKTQIKNWRANVQNSLIANKITYKFYSWDERIFI